MVRNIGHISDLEDLNGGIPTVANAMEKLPQKIEIFEFRVFCTGNGNVENTDADLPDQSAERVSTLLWNRYIFLFTKI